MQVIGLCGYAGSGKDSAAECLVSRGWVRVAFADPIREMALAIDPLVFMTARLTSLVQQYGWDEIKRHPETRRLLQSIGMAGRKILGENCWVHVAHDKILITAAKRTAPGIVVTDLRFASELEMLRNWNASIYRVTNPGVGPANDHESESIQEKFTVDAEIENSGTKEELWEKVLKLAYQS